MEVALELEDDLFFADLSKQISLLIMDEDDLVMEQEPLPPHWHYSSSLQGFARSVNNNPLSTISTPISGYGQIDCGREISKGTGVFIPKSSQPRRKNRQGRFSSSSSSSSRRQSNDQYQYNGITRSSGNSQFSQKSSFHPKKF